MAGQLVWKCCFIYFFQFYLNKLINSLSKSILFLILSFLIAISVNYLAYLYLIIFNTFNWGELVWFSYFWLPNQFPIFIYGIVLYFIYKANKFSEKIGSIFLTASIIIFLLLSFIEFNSYLPYAFFRREYFYGLVFMFFAIGLYSSKNKIISNNFIKNIGKVSFSMYLNHFIVIYVLGSFEYRLGRFILNKLPIPEILIRNDVTFIIWLIVTIIITYYFSRLTYKYIEVNGINLGNKLIEKFYNKTAIKKFACPEV